MGRGIEQARILGEARLRAVAVMDVEIDDRDAGEAVRLARPQRPDRDVVEETKAHRPPRLGVMTGRAHRAEGVVGFARHDRIHGGDHGPGRAQRRLAGSGAKHRLGVDRRMSLERHRGQQPLDKAARVNPGNVVE